MTVSVVTVISAVLVIGDGHTQVSLFSVAVVGAVGVVGPVAGTVFCVTDGVAQVGQAGVSANGFSHNRLLFSSYGHVYLLHVNPAYLPHGQLAMLVVLLVHRRSPSSLPLH